MQGLLDFGDYPHIHADGVGDMHFINQQACLLLFRWKKVDGLFRPVVVGTVSAPIAMISPASRIKPLIEQALTRAPHCLPERRGMH
jgi:hypothetical protein